jgi:hypothetical protein
MARGLYSSATNLTHRHKHAHHLGYSISAFPDSLGTVIVMYPGAKVKKIGEEKSLILVYYGLQKVQFYARRSSLWIITGRS